MYGQRGKSLFFNFPWIVLIVVFLFAITPGSSVSLDPSGESECNPAGPRTGTIFIVVIQINSRDELAWLQRYCFDVAGVKENIVTIYGTQKEVGKLREAGYHPVILSRQPDPSGPGVKPFSTGLGIYHSFLSLTADLREYAALFPHITELVSLGNSVKGRALWALKITDNPGVEEDEPEFKYIATMHGDEPVGTELCMYFIDLLLNGYGVEPRITQLVDTTEIWFVPLMNPDGLERGTRYNGAGYDLNRNFPSGIKWEAKSLQPETSHIMNWSNRQSFVLSANFHGGALVVNYPFDDDGLGSVESPTPDDALFRNISLRYSSKNFPMFDNHQFSGGITNGADWYSVRGGMQDWNYRFMSTNEVTIEVSVRKKPSESSIPQFWEDNRESMFSYIELVHIGVRGIVTDSITGSPVLATIYVEGIDHPVFSDMNIGDYHRMLLPGVYNIEVKAPGYKSVRIDEVIVDDGPATRVDVEITPSPRGGITL